MRRLTKLLKKLDSTKQGIPEQFFNAVHVLTLMPGEPIPDTVPQKSWIFVEEGFLLLKHWGDDRWRCTNIYPEGTSTVFYSGGGSGEYDPRLRVEAAEYSTVIYLSSEDEAKVNTFYPHFPLHRAALNSRSFIKNRQTRELYSEEPGRRIALVETFYPYFLRMPMDDLAELLQINSEALPLLEFVQKRYLMEKNYQ